jgi:hypothetical protein
VFAFVVNNNFHVQVLGSLEVLSLIFQQPHEIGIFILHSVYWLENSEFKFK